MNEADHDLYHLDIYNIYGHKCHNTSLTAKPKKGDSILNFDPCSEYYVYFTPEAQKALHANVTKLDHDWQPCSNVLNKPWHDAPYTIIPLLREFMANGLRVWVYSSGDTDGRVPVTSSKNSLRKMKLPVKTSWHAWYYGGEVSGYTQVYKGDLTFATVRGAGHEVPSYQPHTSLSLISHFLNGTPLPVTKRYD